MKNREIKFRAFYDGRMEYMDNKTPTWVGDILTDTEYYNPMQYTGLKDKTGREIYEGDIVKTQYDIAKVLWLDEGAQFIVQYIDDPDGNWDIMADISCGGDYEVIGNIYENPELLEQ